MLPRVVHVVSTREGSSSTCGRLFSPHQGSAETEETDAETATMDAPSALAGLAKRKDGVQKGACVGSVGEEGERKEAKTGNKQAASN